MTYTRTQAVLVAAFMIGVAWFLFSAVTRHVPIPLTGTAVGPCRALPEGMTVATVDVYAGDGTYLTSGGIGRWRPAGDAGQCMTSVSVVDVEEESDWYELRIGPMVANVDGGRLFDGQIFEMKETSK